MFQRKKQLHKGIFAFIEPLKIQTVTNIWRFSSELPIYSRNTMNMSQSTLNLGIVLEFYNYASLLEGI